MKRVQVKSFKKKLICAAVAAALSGSVGYVSAATPFSPIAQDQATYKRDVKSISIESDLGRVIQLLKDERREAIRIVQNSPNTAAVSSAGQKRRDINPLLTRLEGLDKSLFSGGPNAISGAGVGPNRPAVLDQYQTLLSQVIPQAAARQQAGFTGDLSESQLLKLRAYCQKNAAARVQDVDNIKGLYDSRVQSYFTILASLNNIHSDAANGVNPIQNVFVVVGTGHPAPPPKLTLQTKRKDRRDARHKEAIRAAGAGHPVPTQAEMDVFKQDKFERVKVEGRSLGSPVTLDKVDNLKAVGKVDVVIGATFDKIGNQLNKLAPTATPDGKQSGSVKSVDEQRKKIGTRDDGKLVVNAAGKGLTWKTNAQNVEGDGLVALYDESSSENVPLQHDFPKGFVHLAGSQALDVDRLGKKHFPGGDNNQNDPSENDGRGSYRHITIDSGHRVNEAYGHTVDINGNVTGFNWEGQGNNKPQPVYLHAVNSVLLDGEADVVRYDAGQKKYVKLKDGKESKGDIKRSQQTFNVNVAKDQTARIALDRVLDSSGDNSKLSANELNISATAGTVYIHDKDDNEKDVKVDKVTVQTAEKGRVVHVNGPNADHDVHTLTLKGDGSTIGLLSGDTLKDDSDWTVVNYDVKGKKVTKDNGKGGTTVEYMPGSAHISDGHHAALDLNYVYEDSANVDKDKPSTLTIDKKATLFGSSIEHQLLTVNEGGRVQGIIKAHTTGKNVFGNGAVILGGIIGAEIDDKGDSHAGGSTEYGGAGAVVTVKPSKLVGTYEKSGLGDYFSKLTGGEALPLVAFGKHKVLKGTVLDLRGGEGGTASVISLGAWNEFTIEKDVKIRLKGSPNAYFDGTGSDGTLVVSAGTLLNHTGLSVMEVTSDPEVVKGMKPGEKIGLDGAVISAKEVKDRSAKDKDVSASQRRAQFLKYATDDASVMTVDVVALKDANQLKELANNQTQDVKDGQREKLFVLDSDSGLYTRDASLAWTKDGKKLELSAKPVINLEDSLKQQGLTEGQAKAIAAHTGTLLEELFIDQELDYHDAHVMVDLDEAVDNNRLVQLANEVTGDTRNNKAHDVNVAAMRQITRGIERRLHSQKGATALAAGDAFESGNFWGRYIHHDGKMDKDGDILGYSAKLDGITLGVDGEVNEQLTVGFAFTYAKSDSDTNTISQTTKGDYYAGTLYGGWTEGPWFMDGMLTYMGGSNDYKSKVNSLSYKGSGDVQNWGVTLGGGYNLALDEQWTLQPRGEFNFQNSTVDSYNLKGADNAVWHSKVKLDDYKVYELGFGARVLGEVDLEEGTLIPEFRLMGYYDFNSDKNEAEITDTAVQKLKGKKREQGRGVAGLGIAYAMENNLTLGLDYDYDFNGKYTAHSVMAKISYEF